MVLLVQRFVQQQQAVVQAQARAQALAQAHAAAGAVPLLKLRQPPPRGSCGPPSRSAQPEAAVRVQHRWNVRRLKLGLSRKLHRLLRLRRRQRTQLAVAQRRSAAETQTQTQQPAIQALRLLAQEQS